MTPRFPLPKALLASFAGLAFGLAATAAGASTMNCTTPGGGGSAATFTLGDAAGAACFSGNDTNQVDANFTLFGETGWVLSDKNDGPDGDGVIEFTTAPANNSKSGVWAIDTLAGLSEVVITLKAGKGFAAFLLDLSATDPLTGTWTSSKDLSHASIYYRGTVSAIPLPAGGLLLLTGLGGIGLAARRRRRAT